MKNERSLLLLIIPWLVFCFGTTEAKSKKTQWYSSSYNIELSYHYTSQCNPGYCEGEKILELVHPAEEKIAKTPSIRKGQRLQHGNHPPS